MAYAHTDDSPFSPSRSYKEHYNVLMESDFIPMLTKLKYIRDCGYNLNGFDHEPEEYDLVVPRSMRYIFDPWSNQPYFCTNQRLSLLD